MSETNPATATATDKQAVTSSVEKHWATWVLDFVVGVGALAQVGIGLVLIFQLNAYNKSNDLTQQSLKVTKAALLASRVPWMESGPPEITQVNQGLIHIHWVLKNTSESPALNLRISFSLEGIEVPQFNPSFDCLFCMPNETSEFNLDFGTPDATAIFQKITTGQVIIEMKAFYTDAFNQPYTLIEDGKYLNNKLVPTHFEIQGVPGI